MQVIGVVKDDELVKDSKDASRKSQAMASKGRDKEETDIETLTRVVKKLTTKVSKLIQQKIKTFASSHPPRQRQARNSSNINQPAPKTAQISEFQVE